MLHFSYQFPINICRILAVERGGNADEGNNGNDGTGDDIPKDEIN